MSALDWFSLRIAFTAMYFLHCVVCLFCILPQDNCTQVTYYGNYNTLIMEFIEAHELPSAVPETVVILTRLV